MKGSLFVCWVVAAVVSGVLVEEVEKVDGACEWVVEAVDGGEGAVVGGFTLEVVGGGVDGGVVSGGGVF